MEKTQRPYHLLNLSGYRLPASLVAIGVTTAICLVISPLCTLVFLILGFLSFLILIKPELGAYLAAATILLQNLLIETNYNFGSRFDIKIPVSYIPIIISCCVFLIRKVIYNKTDKNPSCYHYITNLLMAVFLGLATVSLIWTYDLVRGIQSILALYLCFAVTILYPAFINKKKLLRRLLIVISFTGVIVALETFLSENLPDFSLQYEFTENIWAEMLLRSVSQGEIRPGGVATPNIAANLLTISIFINIILAYLYKLRVKILMALVTLLEFYALVKTASKAGLLILLFGLFLLPIIIPELRKRIIRILSPLFAVMAVGLVLMGKALVQRFSVMFESVEFGALPTRSDFWGLGFKHLWETGLIGLGTGGFGSLETVPYAHSVYFSILFEYGVIGFLVYFLFLASLICYAIKNIPRIKDYDLRISAYCLFLTLIMILIHALVDLDYNYFPLYLIIGILFSCFNIPDNDGQTIANAKESGT